MLTGLSAMTLFGMDALHWSWPSGCSRRKLESDATCQERPSQLGTSYYLSHLRKVARQARSMARHRHCLVCLALVACGRTELDRRQDALASYASSSAGTSASLGAEATGGLRATGGVATGGSTASGGAISTGGGTYTTGGTVGEFTGGAAAPSGGAPSGGSSTGVGGSAACTITVSVPMTIQSAIDACPSPGTVCVNPGLYPENLTLRDGVDVRGSGLETKVCGTVSADAATTFGVSLSQLSISSKLSAKTSVRLMLADIDTAPQSSSDCPTALDHNIELARSSGTGINLSATRVKVGPWGFFVTLGGSDVPVQDRILIEQSRCVDPYQCWSFIELTLGSNTSGTFPAGSRLSVELTNNLVPNVVLDGLVFQGVSTLNAEDLAQSLILLRHNTIVSDGDPNYGIDFWSRTQVPTVLANNVVAYIGNPLHNAEQPYIMLSSNVVSSTPDSKAWFEDFDGGDFTPSANSPLLGAADTNYAVPVDIDGRPRTGRYDIGAYQRP
jgi:hypothetical protein